MVNPPIIVIPVGLESPLSDAECEMLAQKIRNCDEGDVLVFPFEADVLTFLEGYWLPVQDLAAFHSSPPDVPEKREPGESTYDPTRQ